MTSELQGPKHLLTGDAIDALPEAGRTYDRVSSEDIIPLEEVSPDEVIERLLGLVPIP